MGFGPGLYGIDAAFFMDDCAVVDVTLRLCEICHEVI